MFKQELGTVGTRRTFKAPEGVLLTHFPGEVTLFTRGGRRVGRFLWCGMTAFPRRSVPTHC